MENDTSTSVFVNHDWFLSGFSDDGERDFVNRVLIEKNVVELIQGTVSSNDETIYGIQVVGTNFKLGWYNTLETALVFCDWFFLPVITRITLH
jgi:hypothetical protein